MSQPSAADTPASGPGSQHVASQDPPEDTPGAAQEEDAAFAPIRARMEAAEVPEIAIRTFARQVARLRAGETGRIPEAEARPVDALPDAEALAARREEGRAALDRAVLIKLNGGLGTSMGLRGPKSLLEVREGQTFLDIAARQVLHLRGETGARLPLVLMDSFATRAPSLERLAAHPELASDLPPDFLQHRVPKLRADDLQAADWPEDPAKEWCPPGHGDLYPALVSRGMLEAMLDAGYEYAFVSNIDNLGAVLDLGILGHLAANGLPFLMEVADRTPADRKGGHLARRPDGQLLLRESAQCPPEEREGFQDIARYRYFNTNNLWLHLPSLRRALAAGGGVLELPLIRNEKPVDPTRPDSPRVYQLETAMGSAIEAIPGAAALRVARSRFAPVKRNDDLLLLRSDAYRIDEAWRVVPAEGLGEGGAPLPDVRLDPATFGRYEDLRARFPYGPPSLIACRSLQVAGDVRFGREVRCVGDVRVASDGERTLRIPDGAVLEG